MESYQSIVMAECAMRDHRERMDALTRRWHLTGAATPAPSVRESLAGALITLARRLAPQHAALAIQHR